MNEENLKNSKVVILVLSIAGLLLLLAPLDALYPVLRNIILKYRTFSEDVFPVFIWLPALFVGGGMLGAAVWKASSKQRPLLLITLAGILALGTAGRLAADYGASPLRQINIFRGQKQGVLFQDFLNQTHTQLISKSPERAEVIQQKYKKEIPALFSAAIRDPNVLDSNANWMTEQLIKYEPNKAEETLKKIFEESPSPSRRIFAAQLLIRNFFTDSNFQYLMKAVDQSSNYSTISTIFNELISYFEKNKIAKYNNDMIERIGGLKLRRELKVPVEDWSYHTEMIGRLRAIAKQ